MSTRSAAKQKKKPLLSRRQNEPADYPRVAIDEDGTIVYASDAFCVLAGMDLEQARRSKASDIIRIADGDEAFSSTHMFASSSAMDPWVAALRPGEHPVVVGGDTHTRSFYFEWLSVPDGRKYLIGSTGGHGPSKPESVLKLITESERIRQAGEDKISRESAEGELRHFMNLSHDLMAVTALDGGFKRVNGTFNALLGFPDEKLRALTFLDLVVPDDRGPVRTSLHGITRENDSTDGTVIDFESRMLDAEGALHWMDWRFQRVGGNLYCVGRDLTAIKTHEEALREREAQLSEAESIGRMGHWHWTIGDDHIDFSDEIYKIFGIERGRFTPSLDNLSDYVHRRDVGRLLQAFQRAILEGNDYDMEFRVLRPDGETRYVRCQGRCEMDGGDEVVGLFGIMQDITERTIHEINLRAAKDAAERAYAAKSQFLANMSHELRTPLNAIIGFSEMMQQQLLGPIGTEKYLEYINGIRESGEHLLDLISDILNMSRIEAGKYELDLEDINVAKVIRLALHMVDSKARDAGLSVELEIANEDLQIVADRRAVMQIMLNLLSNAVKFTGPGGRVKIECLEREDYVSIKVTDNGIGIPANKLSSICRPFEQAASQYTRDHEGSGLGLAITKELTEMHGGTLHIESTLGVGTTVTVRLPFDAGKYDRTKGR